LLSPAKAYLEILDCFIEHDGHALVLIVRRHHERHEDGWLARELWAGDDVIDERALQHADTVRNGRQGGGDHGRSVRSDARGSKVGSEDALRGACAE
jgi:hypothetical protein